MTFPPLTLGIRTPSPLGRRVAPPFDVMCRFRLVGVTPAEPRSALAFPPAAAMQRAHSCRSRAGRSQHRDRQKHHASTNFSKLDVTRSAIATGRAPPLPCAQNAHRGGATPGGGRLAKLAVAGQRCTELFHPTQIASFAKRSLIDGAARMSKAVRDRGDAPGATSTLPT